MQPSPVELALENAYLRDQLAKRLRLVWAALIFGIIVGLVIATIFGYAPTTFGPEVWS